MDIYQERLKCAREKLGLSQVAISNLLGMKPQQWYKYESGTSKMSLDTLKLFCETFKVSANWLLGLDMEEEATTRQLYTKARNEIYRASKAIDNGSMSGEQKAALLQQLQHLMDELK